MQTSLHKPTYAALNLALAAAGLGCICYSLLRVPVPVGEVQPAIQGNRPVARQMVIPRSLPYAPWAQLAGAGALLGAAALHEREQLELGDYENALEGVFAGGVNVGRDALAIVQSLNRSKPVRTAQTILIRNLPAPIKNRMQQLEDQHQSDVIFKRFIAAPHNRLAGKTGAGKTFLLLALLIQWLEENPDGIVTICDRNYGKPDRETGEPFYWNGFPRASIRFTDVDIFLAVREEYREMERRIADCRDGKKRMQDLRPRLLIITELDSTQEEIDGNNEEVGSKKGEFIGTARKIIKQGNGYRMKVITDGQTLSAGESGISEATRDNLSSALLGNTTTNAKQVAKLDCNNVDELIATCNAILKSGKRPGIIQLNEGDPIAIVMPDLSWVRDVRFAAAEIALTQALDPVEQWWQQAFTPEAQKWLDELALGITSGEIKTQRGKGALKEFVMPYFDVKKFDDPKRVKLSEAWEAAKKRVKTKEKVNA